MDQMLLISATMVLMVCVTVPILTRNYSLFTIWNYFLAFVVLNIVVRTYFIVFDIGTIDPWSTFLKNLSIEDLIWGSLMYSMSCFFLCLGYLSVGKKAKLSFWPRGISSVGFNSSYVRTIQLRLLFVLVISLGSFLYFIYSSSSGLALNVLENLSGYRGTTSNLAEYSARGYLRLLISFSELVFFISVYLIIIKQGSKRLLIIFAILSFLIALAMGIFTSSRSSVIMLFVEILILKILSADKKVNPLSTNKKVNPLTITVVAASIIILFTFMTSLRPGSGLEEFNLKGVLVNFASHAILNNGGLDISKTILVKQYVDATFNMHLGSTLFLFMFLAIPRSLWPDKPVNLDTFIGFEVYGAQTFGTGAVPPGFPAEMYLNFHYVGLVVGLFILGAVSKMLHNDFLQRRSEPLYLLYYVLVPLSVLYSVMASGFSSTLIGKLVTLIPLVIILKRKWRFKKKI